MKVPVISVLVPIYNSSRYLTVCLDSLIRQTFADIEIICMDDGSTDNSLILAQTYAQKDSRIHVFSPATHQGIANIRNLLLEKASGEYIAFVDSDDIVAPDYLEVLYREAVQSNADIVRGLYYLLDTQTNKRQPCTEVYKEFLRKEPDARPISRLQAALDDTQVWLKLIRMEVIRANQIRFLPNSLAEDLSFEILLYQYADKIRFVLQYLYTYRVGNPLSISARKFLCACGTLENLIFASQELVRRQKAESTLYTRMVVLIFHAMRRLRKFTSLDEKKQAGKLCREGFLMITQRLSYISPIKRIQVYSICCLARLLPDQYLPYLASCIR